MALRDRWEGITIPLLCLHNERGELDPPRFAAVVKPLSLRLRWSCIWCSGWSRQFKFLFYHESQRHRCFLMYRETGSSCIFEFFCLSATEMISRDASALCIGVTPGIGWSDRWHSGKFGVDSKVISAFAPLKKIRFNLLLKNSEVCRCTGCRWLSGGWSSPTLHVSSVVRHPCDLCFETLGRQTLWWSYSLRCFTTCTYPTRFIIRCGSILDILTHWTRL